MSDYPGTQAEFEARFSTEAACWDYLALLRWPDGFTCPRCGGFEAWLTTRGLWHCRRCGRQTSATCGTLFHRTRKPLSLWFRAMWHITSQKYGANALGLQRVLDLGSYRTAWQWLHKLRQAMVRPGRDRLSGSVQVDETYLGASHSGKRGRGALGKALVIVAVEDKGSNVPGRIRLQHVADGKAASLNAFIQQSVVPGSAVFTDDYQGYAQLPALGYGREIVNPLELKLPHLISSLMKRWLLGTYQGAVRTSHLSYYLDEYTFRFNRRRSRSRGLLFYRLVEQALMVGPASSAELKPVLTSSEEENLDDLRIGPYKM
jgi:transposase-like protein